MSGTVNLTKLFKKQGLDKSTSHEAVVVNNDDTKSGSSTDSDSSGGSGDSSSGGSSDGSQPTVGLGRIQARITGIHEGIEDKMLPWAIPKYAHVDGAKGGDDFDRSGTFYVPKVGTKVLIEYQDNDPHYPVWSGYTVDDTTALKEISKNYPNRAIMRFSTGAFMMIDTQTNETWIHNPGDMYMIVQGDVEMDVFGNMQEVVGKLKGKAIDPYFLDDENLPIKEAEQSQTNNVEYLGLGTPSKSGNRHIQTDGDLTMRIGGNRIVIIEGDDTLTVKGKQTITVDGDIVTNGGKNIELNADGAVKITAGSDIKMEANGTLSCKASNIFLN